MSPTDRRTAVFAFKLPGTNAEKDMHVRHRSMTTLGSALAILLAGCASTTTVRQADALADAGIVYGAAGGEVIAVTRDRYLDWKALALIEELPATPLCTPRELASADGRSAGCTEAMSEMQEDWDADRRFVADLDVLAAHADALRRYFGALKAMAAYDARGSASTATAQLIERIDALNAQLESNAPIGEDKKKAWAALAGLVGDTIKSRHLRDALRRDAAAIGKAIDLQSQALAFHAMTLDGIDQNARAFEYERNIKGAYLTGTAAANPDAWIARRRAALMPAPEVVQLQKLRAASESLKTVWNDILQGRTDPQAAQEVLADAAAALKILNDIRKAHADDH